MLGKNEDRRRRGQQKMTCLDGTIDSTDMSLSKLQEIVKEKEAWCYSPWGRKESDTAEQLNNSSKMMLSILFLCLLVISVSSLVKCLFKSSIHLEIGLCLVVEF